MAAHHAEAEEEAEQEGEGFEVVVGEWLAWGLLWFFAFSSDMALNQIFR